MSSRFVSSLCPAALSLLVFAFTPALHASSITYDLTLSPTSGSQGGTGTLTLATAPAASGISTYTIANHQLQDLSFTIDGQTFFLTGDPSASVQFTDGQLTQINFLQTVNSAPDRYTLELSNDFTLYGNGFGHALVSGSFSATPAAITPEYLAAGTSESAQPASPTPEPGSMLLLATALLAGSFLLFRRKRAASI